jgi:conjugal transfer mating pair stabilization protein TraN
MYTNTYSCRTKEAVKEKKLSCSTDVFNTASFTTPTNANSTFPKAALASEILRQAGTYNKDGLNIFSGVQETCRKGYAGIKNCCKAKPGATSNSAMMSLTMSAGASVVKYAGAKAVDMASPYVFDAMYAGGEFTAGLALDIAGSSTSVVYDFSSEAVGTNFAAGGPSLSAYGFTYQSGTAAAGSGVFGANTTLATFGEGSSMTSITFNPYVFGAMVAITVIQELASCSKEEQMLALHKGANLTTYVTQWCSQKVLGACVEHTESYCSFNSVLAKIINTQGKPQLGLPVSDCKGLSTEQVSSIDFAKIDFSEFVSQITNQANSNLPTGIKENYTPEMTNKNAGSQQGSSPANPAYK